MFQAGDMVEQQTIPGKSTFGFAILAKTHEMKLRGFADTEEDLMRWIRAFNACINSFTVATAAKAVAAVQRHKPKDA